jgi:hypothetical protein
MKKNIDELFEVWVTGNLSSVANELRTLPRWKAIITAINLYQKMNGNDRVLFEKLLNNQM